MKFSRVLCSQLVLVGSLSAGFANSAEDRVAAFAKLPDWRGIWINEEGADTGISGFDPDLGKPGVAPFALVNPGAPWRDEARQKLLGLFTSGADRKGLGWGFPMMMNSPSPLQFLITPEETLILNLYQEARHVYTDGRAHPPEEDRWITTWGDSVGHWEGDTLVIDTIWVRDPLRYFQMSPPFSEDAHYVERLRRSGPDRIEWEMTIEDPATLLAPMIVKGAFQRTSNLDRIVHDAFENDRSEVEGGTFTIAPPKE